MKTLIQIRDEAIAKKACETQLNPFCKAIDEGDDLLAWQMVLGNNEWLIDAGIIKKSDLKAICIEAQGIGLRFYTSGNVESRWNYKDGKLHGLCEWFYESGNIKHRYNYKDGKLPGIYEWFYESGNIKHRWNYKDGKRLNEQDFKDSDNEKSEATK